MQHGHEQIAKALGQDKKDVDIICAGLNHQTWYISVKTDVIEGARKRLENKTIPYRPVKGFTLKTKTVEEMAAEKEISQNISL